MELDKEALEKAARVVQAVCEKAGDGWCRSLAQAAITAYLASLSERGFAMMPSGEFPTRENPTAPGLTPAMLYAGMAVLMPIYGDQKDDVSNVVAEIWQKMFDAHSEPKP